jgi:cellulose synthase/poly-beta-1,6-N-acetylglucosamine synthase-like glycosyltransferase
MGTPQLVEQEFMESQFCTCDSPPRFAIVIPAQDEADILRETLDALTAITKDLVEIHVVADHCRDDTAAIATRPGVRVHIRNDQGPAGKGPALHWWLLKTHTEASPDQIIIVMDADSRVTPGFIESIQTSFINGTQAAQTRIEPFISSTTPLELISSLSEIVEHRIIDSLRDRLGWSVRLRGTGMVFRRDLLEQHSELLHTTVEDLELTIILASAGVRIEYLPQIIVHDPKPQDPKGAVHQRARWLRGQFQVFRSYTSRILRLFLQGPKGWSLLASGLLKPRTFFFPLKAIAVTGFLILATLGYGSLWKVLATIGIASVLIDIGVFLFGIRYTRFRLKTLAALAASPLYFILWIQSLVLALIHRQPWLSSRRSVKDPPCQQTTQIPRCS